MTVLVLSDEAKISGNQRSFQMGIMLKTATVPNAGRTKGSTSAYTRYSLAPSMRAASLRSPGTWRINCVRIKTASGIPEAE